MDFSAVKRDYGRGVDRYFAGLPEHLGAAAADFLSRLAKDCPPAGDFRDFGGGDEGFPVLDTLLNFFNEAQLADERIRRTIFEGASFALLAAVADEFALDSGRDTGPSLGLLSQAFFREAERIFGTLFPPGSVFRTVFDETWRDHAEALLWHRLNHIDARRPYRDEDRLKIGRRWSPVKFGFAAVLAARGREADLPAIDRLMDEWTALFQIRREILDIPRDAARRVHSLAIDRIATRLPDGLTAADRPEALLGALLLDDPVSGLIRECLERVEFCRGLGERIAPAAFGPVLENLRLSFLGLAGLFSLGKSQTSRAAPAAPGPEKGSGFVMKVDPGLTARIRAAREFLLSDPDFRESWEVHRWGFLGEERLTGKIFPAGFILESLFEGGLDMPERLDALFSHWRSIDRRYFDEACPLPPDADSLGLMLRLLRFSKRPEDHRAVLRPALDRMTPNIAGDGDIPTYFKIQPPGEAPRSYFREIAGNDCTGVKAGLALGLRRFDDGPFRAAGGRLMSRIFETIAATGSASNVYYPLGYWLWMMLRLADAGTDDASSPSPEKRASALAAIRTEFESLGGSAHISPQRAAWLVLCRFTTEGRGEIPRDWPRILVSNQRADGGWDAEPFYLVPTWGNGTDRHRSRLLTTAICHLALVLCDQRGVSP